MGVVVSAWPSDGDYKRTVVLDSSGTPGLMIRETVKGRTPDSPPPMVTVRERIENAASGCQHFDVLNVEVETQPTTLVYEAKLRCF